LVDIVVPEAKHSESAAFEPLIAQSIALRMLSEIMLAAVDFNDEAMPQADKIHDGSTTRRLAAEVKSALPP
jgi:hypothetical protein